MDENFDRSVGFEEFMQFFLVLWTTRLKRKKEAVKQELKGNKALSRKDRARIKQLQVWGAEKIRKESKRKRKNGSGVRLG